MPLTNTTHHISFTRDLPVNTTFAFPLAPSSSPSSNPPSSNPTPSPPSGITTVTIQPPSTFTTGLHWHDTHTEYLRVTKGAALLTINNKSFIATPIGDTSGERHDAGFITIPRKARHEWARWDVPGRKGHQLAAQEEFRRTMRAHGREEGLDALAEGDLIAEEWTDPNDGAKEVFFRNIFSAMQEPRSGFLGNMIKFLQMFIVMWEGDNMLVFWDLSAGDADGGWRARVEELVTHVVMGLVARVGQMVFGLKGVNKEYTPEYLMCNDERGGQGKNE